MVYDSLRAIGCGSVGGVLLWELLSHVWAVRAVDSVVAVNADALGAVDERNIKCGCSASA